MHAFAILHFSLNRKALHHIGLSQIAVPSGFSEKTSSVDVVESSPVRGEIVRSITEKAWVQCGHFSFLGNHFALFSGENMAVIQLKMKRN